jgi:hypothetical protein
MSIVWGFTTEGTEDTEKEDNSRKKTPDAQLSRTIQIIIRRISGDWNSGPRNKSLKTVYNSGMQSVLFSPPRMVYYMGSASFPAGTMLMTNGVLKEIVAFHVRSFGLALFPALGLPCFLWLVDYGQCKRRSDKWRFWRVAFQAHAVATAGALFVALPVGLWAWIEGGQAFIHLLQQNLELVTAGFLGSVSLVVFAFNLVLRNRRGLSRRGKLQNDKD